MSESSIKKTLGRTEITPRRFLSQTSNRSLSQSTFYRAIDEAFGKHNSSFLHVFGDIIFSTEKMKMLYVQQRDNPFYYFSDTQEKIPIAMNSVLKEIYNDNYFVYLNDDDRWYKYISSYETEFDNFIKKGERNGKPEASLEHMLNIIYPSNKSRIERLLLIIGGIGCGKTTFISRYLSQNSNLSYLFIDFNFIITTEKLDRSTVYDIIYKKILNIDHENIGKNEYRKEIFEEKIKESEGYFYNKKKVINSYRLISKLQEWFEDKEILVTSYLSYKSSTNKFLLIFDNIDLHPNDNQDRLYEFSKELINAIPDLKIILTMREYTFGNIQQKYHGTLVNQPLMHLTSPDIKDVITKRISMVVDIVVSQKIKIIIESQTNFQNNLRLTVSKVKALVRNILDPILLQKSLFFLVSISNSNTKLILANVIQYLSSPYLMSTKLFKRIITESVIDSYPGARISFDEFIQIMLLGSNKYYEQKVQPNHKISILNLYRTDITNKSSRCFLIQRTIDYALKHWENEMWIKKGKLIKTIKNGLCIEEKTALGCIDNLLKSGTLESPDGEDLGILNENSPIFPTRKAWYYSHRLSKYLTYIRLIQYDLHLDYKQNDISNFEKFDDNEIVNYLLFIDWIRRIERKEVTNLNEDNRADYLQLLGEKPLCLKVFKSFVKRLNELICAKKVDCSIITTNKVKIKGLFREIERNIRKLEILPEVENGYLNQVESDLDKLFK